MNAFQQLPIWAKAAFAFLAIVIAVFGYESFQGGFNQAEMISNQSAEVEWQDVNITIRNRGNTQPIENVTIQIVFEGPPVQKMSDRNGYVEIKIPKRQSVQVTLFKDGFKTVTETINLETDPNTTRTIYLDQNTP